MRPGFTGAGIDRADHLRLDEARIAEMKASLEARLLRMESLDPLVEADGRIGWGKIGDLADGADTIFLGMAEEGPLFAPLIRLDGPAGNPRAMYGLIATMPPQDAAIWGTARSLNEWHNRHRHCGACGTATVSFRAGWGRRCAQCAIEHFPRVDPVVIMLAEYRGRVLVGRQHQYPPGRYSALAGFVEPGESIEEAVIREIREEAGISARDVRYVASQPWPFPGSLMIGCMAQAESDALTLDASEIEDAMWIDRDEAAAALAGAAGARFDPPPPFAIAHSLLARWAASGG